ncbi:putative ribonuclease H-like domain-containing protein, partial [Tanacetum coccineum]
MEKGHRTKWVIEISKEERGVVVRKQSKIGSAGNTARGRIDYDEIEEEYMFSQPPCFQYPNIQRKSIQSGKALIGYSSSKSMYATLSTFLLKNGYRRGTIDKTLFLKKDKHDIILVQFYVDDIIFGSTKKKIRCAAILKKFDFASVLRLQLTPIETQNLYLGPFIFQSVLVLGSSHSKTSHLSAIKENFLDSDYARANLDRKSTTGGCQFLGRRLITWQCKKQTIVATSTTKSNNVAELASLHMGMVRILPLLKHLKTMSLNRPFKEYFAFVLSIPPPRDVVYVMFDNKGDAYHWSGVYQDEGASSERLSVEQPSPSPAPTNESLHDSSSAQPSEVPFEQQPDPSPRPSPTPSPTPIVPDSIPEPTGENLGDHSSNDESLSGNEDDMTLQNVYDLCISLCQQVSDQAKEIKLLKAKITKLKKKAKPVIKHHKEYLKIISLQQRFPKKSFSKKQRVHKKSVSKQGRKKAKGESEVHRDPLFDVMHEDKIDHMETENAQSEGRTRDMVDEEKEFDEERLSTEDEVSTDKEGVSTDFEKVSTDRPKVSTDESKVSTDEQVEGTEEHNESTEEIFEGTEEQREGTEDKVSTDEQMEGTEDQTKEEIASKASQTSTQTPTSMTFGDDETIATLLLNMSKAKAASKEKEKGVELKDVEEIDRPRPTSTRSLLTLKPLPKIDPKDKGKKKIEEEEESESEDDDIPQAVKKFKQLESDEELARKIQE